MIESDFSKITKSGGDYFDDAPILKQSYDPQSGEIFVILKQMKESF